MQFIRRVRKVGICILEIQEDAEDEVAMSSNAKKLYEIGKVSLKRILENHNKT